MDVRVGNRSAIVRVYEPEVRDDGEVIDHFNYHPLPGDQVTFLRIPDGEVQSMVTEVVGCLSLHMESGTKPVWIECDDESLTKALAAHYAMDTVDQPEDWKAT